MRRGYPRGGSEDPRLHKTGGSVSLPLGTYITQHVPEEDMKEAQIVREAVERALKELERKEGKQEV